MSTTRRLSCALAVWALVESSSAFFLRTTRPHRDVSLSVSYLESLHAQQPLPSTPQVPVNGVPSASQQKEGDSISLCHAPLSYFHLDNMVSKGPRATFDWGTPQDWSRKLADDGTFRAGAWYCTEGGWPSPNGKAVTEVFYVLEGHGALSDSDGETHYFGPGDMVVIPKGHTGRWDVNQPIHKVWAVNAHANVEESEPVRVRVDHYHTFAEHHLAETNGRDPLYGSTSPMMNSSSRTLYNVGPTQVGVWGCSTPGSYYVSHGARSWFHMLEGTLFITDESTGSSRRCVAGDTVMLPQGWSGYIDVLASAKKVWVTAA